MASPERMIAAVGLRKCSKLVSEETKRQSKLADVLCRPLSAYCNRKKSLGAAEAVDAPCGNMECGGQKH